MDRDATLVRPLASLRAGDGDTAGGKASNLGELLAGGFAVPDGFVVTTDAYVLAAADARLDPVDPDDAADRLRAVALPAAVSSAVLDAYSRLGSGPVAVRSSATAEDLPGASFAGQQDTYLDVSGNDALLDAIRRCWASLWNERAVAYRRDHGLDDRTVSIAVVVQQMVDASAAGVLFTADPITSRRGRAVIDAAPGLGEAVVSGAVDPDHYAVDTGTGDVVERSVRGDSPVLGDAALREIAAVGTAIERHFGVPQDIEFALDADGRLWIVQARPITTLFPLPDVEVGPSDLRVYFSVSVAQGYFEPFTPMGLEPVRAIGRNVAGAFARRRLGDGPVRSPIVFAGERPFVDVTPVIRDPLGREVMERMTAVGEARSSIVVHRLAEDPRLAARSGSRPASVTRILPLLVGSRIPLYALRMLRAPRDTRERFVREIEATTRIDLRPSVTAGERLDEFERLTSVAPPYMFPRLLGVVVAGFVSYLAVRRLLGDRASEDELQTLTRALPHNPTTEMDLALWTMTRELRDDATSVDALRRRAPDDLAAAYRDGSLPPQLQRGLSAFLDVYGFRSVGEIDLGVVRWSEDPTHLIGAIANYLRLDDDALAPDARFERGAAEAKAMSRTLLGRVGGPRRMLLRFFLSRVRGVMGSRELPKYTLIRRWFTPLRELLKPVGFELAAAGLLDAWDDVFFLTLAEARRALAGEDLRSAVASRRATHVRESARRHIPRLLLSDGTDAEAALVVDVADGALRGSPASPGSVSGPARVVLSPRGARLAPGEILVAPSTDPGWTPLFLTAGGLVMEMGGMMSHGAVVAREYGIPAVVGVAGATERIHTGDEITVDGSAGVVSGDNL